MAGSLQALNGTHNTDIIPHEAAQFVPIVREHDFLVGIRDAALVPLRQVGQGLPFRQHDVPGSCGGENQAFKQRIAGQPVGTMKAGEGGFANCIQAGQGRAGIQVGDDAAAGIVRCRNDRYGLASNVDAQFQTASMDVREMLNQKVGRLVRHVKIDTIEAAFLHLEVDSAGHDVARCQLATGVVLGHESFPAWQTQYAAFTTHGFGDEKCLGVGMV